MSDAARTPARGGRARRRRRAASRTPTARPLTASDRALLARPATYEEQIARAGRPPADRAHASRFAAARSASSDPRVLGVTPFSATGPVDYFLMRPAECTYLAWFRQAPARWDPRTCAASRLRAASANIAMALAVVAHESYHMLGYRERGAGRVLRHAVDLVRREQARRRRSPSRRRSRRSTRRACIPRGAHDAALLVGRVPRRRQVRPAPHARPLAEPERSR